MFVSVFKRVVLKRAVLMSAFVAASLVATTVTAATVSSANKPTHLSVVQRSNNYPIVLVHGLMGWTKGELVLPNGSPYLYWGYHAEGSEWDIQKLLNDNGYATYESAPSPVLNDRQRAIQIYAQLTGTTADFGAASAAKYGHEQFGKTYAPLFNGFCQNGSPNQKINLLGHSQGGTTARMLAELLANGDPAELEYASAHGISLDNVSPLFKGGQGHCVFSVTTESSPHDGTSLVRALAHIKHLQDYFVALAMGVEGINNSNFEFDLEHWGIERKPGESFSSYLKKVKASALWGDASMAATSFYSLSTEGAWEQNQTNRALPNVYYISQSTDRTSQKSVSVRGCHAPDDAMSDMLEASAALMGCYAYPGVGQTYDVTKAWFANDGLVNTVSQDGPTISNTGLGGDEIQTIGPKKGSWYHRGVIDQWDHGNIVGLGADPNDLRAYYLDLASLIGSLPQ